MKQILFLFLLPAFAFAQPTRTVTHVTDYQPPVFADANRLQKLEAAFPIVEKCTGKPPKNGTFRV